MRPRLSRRPRAVPLTIALLLLVGGCSCGERAATPEAARPEDSTGRAPAVGEAPTANAAEDAPQLLVSLQLLGPSRLG